MTINERIKFLRKEKGLTQKTLASTLGITQSGVSFLEQEGSSVSDQTIKLICTVFGVREEWLRTGEGEMYNQGELFSLDRFVAERGVTELELAIVKAYFELDPAIRQAVLEHFRAHLTADPDELEAEQLKQDYLRQKKAGAASSATAGQNGGEKMA